MARENNEPQHGPIMTPSIFAENWLRKLNFLLERNPQPHDSWNNSLWLPEISKLGMPLIIEFNKQAQLLSLQCKGFPAESRGRPNPMTVIKDETYVNPFALAADIYGLINGFLDDMYQYKLGNKEEMQWKEFAMSYRADLNKLFEGRRQAKEDGVWEVDGCENRKIMMKVMPVQRKNMYW